MKWASMLLTLGLASTAQAQQANHFTYTGELRVGASVVARTTQAPLLGVQLGQGDALEVTLRHEGFTLTAQGTRSGLQMHVHSWTTAHAQGFEMYVPPDARFDVLEGSTERAVIFEDAHLGEARLGAPHALPRWIVEHAQAEDHLYTQCHAVRLYAAPREAGEPLEVPEGMSVYALPPRDGFAEAWVRLDTRWVRGYAREVQCVVEPTGGLGISGEGSFGHFEPPPHVLLPRGLQLVSPAHPRRVVMRVRRPTDAISWGPGMNAESEDGGRIIEEAALMIDLPCGLGEETGHLTFTPSQLVPLGAPRP
jgi:hypothetical protein